MLILCLLGAVPSQIFALFDAQATIGFAGLSYIDDGSTAAAGKFKDTSMQALTLGLAVHVHTIEQNVICLGIGPYIVAGPGMRYTGDAAGTAVSYSSSQFMVGGEIYGKILATNVIYPYVKFAFGVDRLSTQVNSGTISAETKLRGTGYRMILGIEVPIGPTIGIFFEGGSVDSTFSVSGTNVTGDKAKGGGYVFSTGLSVSF